MTVTVRLFAIMAQHAGVPSVALDVPEGSRAGTVRGALESRFAGLPWPSGTMLAVNQEYAGPETLLRAGDEVAVIPPVSGG